MNWPLPSANRAAHSGFETWRRRHQKSKLGVSVAHKWACVHHYRPLHEASEGYVFTGICLFTGSGGLLARSAVLDRGVGSWSEGAWPSTLTPTRPGTFPQDQHLPPTSPPHTHKTRHLPSPHRPGTYPPTKVNARAVRMLLQWQIQDFPKGGGGMNPPRGAVNTQFCRILPKTAWNWKNLDAEGGGVRPSRSPLDPPLYWNAYLFFKKIYHVAL